jgi:uncharacterized protein (DUF1697 family)
MGGLAMRYVAFLRGVNVGGRILRMTNVRSALASAGFADATTYLHTGNLLLGDDGREPGDVHALVSATIERLDPTVRVTLRSADDLQRIVATDPFDRTDDATDSHRYVTFLMSPPATDRSLPAQSTKGDVSVVRVTDGEVYTVARLVGTGYGYPNALVESKLKVAATTRNWTVVSKLAQLLADQDNPA